MGGTPVNKGSRPREQRSATWTRSRWQSLISDEASHGALQSLSLCIVGGMTETFLKTATDAPVVSACLSVCCSSAQRGG